MRIIHAADFHLDSPFDGLAPEQAVQRREEQRQLLNRLAGLVREFRADAVLLAGDLLDGERFYQETIEALARALAHMEVPVFISPGNHDFVTPRSPYRVNPWPDNVHIFLNGAVEPVELPAHNAVVHGAAFTADSREDALSGFSAPADGRLHLMVLHADVDGRQGSKYCPVSQRAIAASGLDYLALGHIHTCSGVQYAGQVPWAYPGCPEGRGFDETGAKGVLCGTVEPGGRAQMDFVPLCKRKYQVTELPVSARDDTESIAAAILSHAAPDDLARFVLTGESGDAGVDLAGLLKRCAGSFYSLSLRDRTRVRRDLWARAEEENLTGLFLRCMREKLSRASSEEERASLCAAVRFGLAALENREDCAP